MTKAQVLNFTTAQVCNLLENAISQPMYTAQSGKLAWPSQKKGQQQLVFFQCATSYIAYRLTEGANLNKAQNEWLSLASTIVNEHKLNHRQIHLIDAGLMLSNKAELKQLLKDHKVMFDASVFESTKTEVPTLEYIAARYRVLAFEELLSLDTLLKTSSLPTTDENELVNVERALQQIKEREQSQLEQIQQVESRLKNLEEQRESEQVQVSDLLKQKQADLDSKQEENELLMLQLQQVQEDLETTFTTAKEAQAKYQNKVTQGKQLEEAYKKDLNMAKQQLESAKKECEQHKEAVNTQVNEQALTELQEENDLLLLQLQQVQDELENYFVRVKDLESDSARSANNEIEVLNTNIQKLERDISQKNRKLHNFSQKIKGLKVDKYELEKEVRDLKSQVLKAHGTPNLPAVIKYKPTPKYRIPSRFLKLVKRPFVGKPESKEQSEFNRQKQVIIDSSMFDEQFYLQQYPDVKKSSQEPVEHYLKFGGFEGRKPNKNFDSAFYLQKYKDVRDSQINPLVHYAQYGIHEKRSISKNK